MGTLKRVGRTDQADAAGRLLKERADEGPELRGALHDLGVPSGRQDGEPAVGEETEHLAGEVETDDGAAGLPQAPARRRWLGDDGPLACAI